LNPSVSEVIQETDHWFVTGDKNLSSIFKNMEFHKLSDMHAIYLCTDA